jgi:nicotinamide-nucleotide amidase
MATGPGSELLSIGSELLLGETIDTNAAFLGGELARLGLPLGGVRQLPDDRRVLAAAFSEARARSPLVVATGGLGPTHDDLTREALADALGEELVEDAALRAALEQRFSSYGPMPPSNLRQARLVASAEAIPNPIGSAPGWWVDRDGSVIVLLPGVPAEMHRMWNEEVRSRLAERFALPPLAIRSVKAFGIGESAAAERLGTLLTSPPDGVDAGIYARDDGIHVRFTTRGAAAGLDGCVAVAIERLGDDAWGTDADELAGVALGALGSAGVTALATEEWGTGGTLYAALSAVAYESGPRPLGGTLDEAAANRTAAAEAVLRLRLHPAGGHGRSRCEVELTGPLRLEPRLVRIHGSEGQRLRRAAYAALDQVRRLGSLTTSDR